MCKSGSIQYMKRSQYAFAVDVHCKQVQNIKKLIVNGDESAPKK